MSDTGFDWVAEPDACILILGSMPGRESLKQQQYYAHPRNAFWAIMGRLFDFDPTIPYAIRLQKLTANRIALWDVAHRCTRPGSLDADIRDAEANDFNAFLAAHPHIQQTCFNGAKAESLFRKLVLPTLIRPLACQRLPSTSPAHAAMSHEEKYRHWQRIRQALEIGPAEPYLVHPYPFEKLKEYP
ncbi:MAG: DNA-deoxyinosine glycosylase [Mariprofundaceae bacterium]